MADSDFKQSNNDPVGVSRDTYGNPSDNKSSNANKGGNSSKGNSKDKDKDKDKDESSSKKDKKKKSKDDDAKDKNQKSKNNNVSTESDDDNGNDTAEKASAAKKGGGVVKKAVGMVKNIINAIQMGAKLMVVLQLIGTFIVTFLAPIILVVVILAVVISNIVNFFSEDTAVKDAVVEVCDVYVDRALIANPYGHLNTEGVFNGDVVDLDDYDATKKFLRPELGNEGGMAKRLDGYSGTTINDQSARAAVARRIYSVMLGYGLRPEQIFGVLGNWMVESGLDPTAVETVFGDDFSLGATKQYFNGVDFIAKQCFVDDMHEGADVYYDDSDATHVVFSPSDATHTGGAVTGKYRQEYFTKHGTIIRIGIGLGQWTDTATTAGTDPKAGTWGRNAKLRRYAMLAGKDETKNDMFLYRGLREHYAIWYDVTTQLAYALDPSDTGDTNSGVFKLWAAGFPWHRLTASNGKTRGALITDEFWDDDCPDANSEHSYKEKYPDHAWRRLGVTDNFAERTGSGDKQIQETMPWHDMEILNPFPVAADNPSAWDDAICEHENPSNKYNVEPTANDIDDGYYDYQPDFEKNLDTEDSNKYRKEAAKKAMDVMKGLWDSEGELGIKHKENIYTVEDYCQGFACQACLDKAFDSTNRDYCPYCASGSHEDHECAYDFDGNSQTDYIEYHDWELVPNTDGTTGSHWELSVSLLHEMRGGDGDGTLSGDHSCCGCAEKRFRRCYNKTYRHILGRFVTEEWAEMFAAQWEGTSKNLEQRKANAVTFYEIWWRNVNADASAALDPNNGQHGDTYNGMFMPELGYSAGIRNLINHTPDQETEKSLQQRNYREHADLLNCKHYVTRRNDDLAMTACQIAGSQTWVTGNPEGTPTYKNIQNQVLKDNICYMACDHTVATAVRWSGVDDDYPAGPTLNQIQYLVSNPRWVEIDWSGDPSELEPGDIFIRKDTMASGAVNEPEFVDGVAPDHHTFMYVGSDIVEAYGAKVTYAEPSALKEGDKFYDCVEGSFGSHGAWFSMLGGRAKHYHVFRCLYKLGDGRSEYVAADPKAGGGGGGSVDYGSFIGD